MMEEEVDVEEEKFTLTEAHTKFAKTTNGEVWELLSKSDRSQAENDAMVQAAHASMYHWAQIGKELQLQRGHWLLAHVYTTLERPEAALYHANYCFQLTQNFEVQMQDFDVAYGYEGYARALALAGNLDEAKTYKERAQQAGDAIKDDEDKSIFMGDFTGGNWHGLA